MTAHSVAEARDKLSSLIDRAIAGEDVVITREGRPVVELRPVPPPALVPRPMTAADVDWLVEQRRGMKLAATDSATLVSALRDEWER